MDVRRFIRACPVDKICRKEPYDFIHWRLILWVASPDVRVIERRVMAGDR